MFGTREFLTDAYKQMGHLYLYNNFIPEKSDRTFIFDPKKSIYDPKNPQAMWFYKDLIKIPLQYIDAEVKLLTTSDGLTQEQADELNKIRGIEIWGLYANEQTASSLASGVNHSAVQEPYWLHTENSAKYTPILKIGAGEKFVGPPEKLGFKRIMIIARI